MHHIFLSSNNLEVLSAWSSLGSAIVALAALIYAVVTINTWKKEKTFDLKVELLSKMSEALTLLNDLNKTYFSESELDEDSKISLYLLRQKHDNVELESVYMLQKGFHNHFKNLEPSIVGMRQEAMKSTSIYKDVEIRRFYQYWCVYEAEIFNTIYNYCHIHMYNFGDLLKDDFLKYSQATMVLPRFDILIQQGNSDIDAINILFENLQYLILEPEYIEMQRIYRKYYFGETA